MDLRRLAAAEADPRYADTLWVRPRVPSRARAAVSLLVDLSDSMRGEKAYSALAGVVLFAEMLNRLRIRFSVIGF